MAKVFLGLGSNLGDRETLLEQALIHLERQGIKVLKSSQIYETQPVGGPPQGKFLNAAVEVETDLSPQDLFRDIKKIERVLGRVPTVRNGPRTIDIDILLYDRIRIQTPELTIPHPRMFERDFVLVPLQEIMPDLRSEFPDENHHQS